MYDASLFDRSLPAGSYWESTVPPLELGKARLQAAACEVAIIGGGFTGLSTALHLARLGVDVALLEAGPLGWGASGRNGGFCCVGSTQRSPDELIRQFGLAETQRFCQSQRQAVELVRSLAETEAIEIEAQGDGEFCVAHRPGCWSDLESDREFWTTVAGFPAKLYSAEALREQGIGQTGIYGGLHLGVGFGLNPMKLVRGLIDRLQQQQIPLWSQHPVIDWEKVGDRHWLHTPDGTLTAKTVVIATNGYTADALHPETRGALLPALSQVITTRPLTDAELAAQQWQTETPVYDTRNLLFYYRLLADRRFLLGSRGGMSGGPDESDRYRRWLTRRLGELFPAWQQVEISHSWNGLVCFSSDRLPHIGPLRSDASVYCGLAYHGNGVAMSIWSGRQLAELITQKQTLADLPAAVRQPLRSFPLPPLRHSYLRAARWLYGWRDRGQ